MRHLVSFLSSLGFMVCTIGAYGAPAATAQAQSNPSADQIVERMLKQDQFGWDEAETTVRMGLTTSSGERSERVLENVRRRKDGQVQSVVRVRAPADIAGMAFLMLQREKGETQQWIYIPSYKKPPRQLVRKDRDGTFMGSDFTYADMERRDTREAAHRRLPDEEIGGVKTYVLESIPKKGTGSSYSKIETWVRQDNFLPMRVRFYDNAGKLLKTLYTKRIKTIDGRPVIVESQMVNKQSGHTTDLVLDNLRPVKDLPDAAFTPTALEHG
jgi:outer membrane lipoprotein-sorting protein